MTVHPIAKARTVWVTGPRYTERQARALAGATGAEWAESWSRSGLGWTGYESAADFQALALPPGGVYTVEIQP